MLWYLLHPNWSKIWATVSLWISKKSLEMSESSQDQFGSSPWPIWTQKVPNEALSNRLKDFIVFFLLKCCILRECQAVKYSVIAYEVLWMFYFGWIWPSVLLFCLLMSWKSFVFQFNLLMASHLTPFGKISFRLV